MMKPAHQLGLGQEARLSDINDRRRQVALQLRVLLDELEGMPIGRDLVGRAAEERSALRAGYAALSRPLKSQQS